MTNTLEDLLLQLLIILFPILLYQFVRLDRPTAFWIRHSDALIPVLSAVCIMLCISFPIRPLTGYFYDLRVIPLIIGVLYGGKVTGILLSLILLLYRSLFGGLGVYAAIFIVCTTVPITYLLRPAYHRASRLKKHGIGSLISLLSWIIMLLFYYYYNTLDFPHLKFFLIFYLIQQVTLVIAINLVENIIENLSIRKMLDNSEKLSLVGEMAASVAHEVRNPLTVTRGFLQFMMEEEASPQKQGYFKIAMDELDRAEWIISDYLSLARPEAGLTEVFDVKEAMQKVMEITLPYANMQGTQITAALSDRCFIRANRQKFHQCMVNLAKNAIEAIPEETQGLLHISAQMHSGEVVIKLADNGKGMSAEEVRRLGTPFYSTKEKGTGLGFMVCHRIIESIQGKIAIQSEKGKGTTVKVTIPSADGR